MDAFDADVLIYAARGDQLGIGIVDLFEAASDGVAGAGSVLLIAELLIKPTRTREVIERDAILALLSRMDLLSVDGTIAELAVTVGASYQLKALDATHLATAITAGADRFITNNRRDFDATAIEEIAVVYPDQLVG